MDVTTADGWAVLDTEPLDAIIHAAAVTPGGFDTAPGRTIRVNLCGTIKALEYARRRMLRRLVSLSSSGVYGPMRSRRALLESSRVSPTTSYGLAKLSAESFVSLYRRAYGLDACSVRLAAPYGPWERPTSVRTRMSMIFRLAVAAVRGESLRVAGAGVARDWTYAADVAAGLAHLATVEALPSDLFNLSSGVRVTLREVVRVVRQVVPESRIEIVRRGKVDLALTREDGRAALDVSRLRSAGFRAMTPLEEGLRHYVGWLRGLGAFVLDGK